MSERNAIAIIIGEGRREEKKMIIIQKMAQKMSTKY